MNCRRVNQSLSAYIDGELPGMEHRLIHDHILHCAECRAEHESLYSTKMLVSRLRMCAPRPELPQIILQRVGSEPRPATPVQAALQEHWQSLRTLIVGRNFAMGVGLAVVGILFVTARVDSPDEIQWSSQPATGPMLTANQPVLDGPGAESMVAASKVDFEMNPMPSPAVPDAMPTVSPSTSHVSMFSTARPMLVDNHR